MTQGTIRVDATYVVLGILAIAVAVALYVGQDSLQAPAAPEAIAPAPQAKPTGTITYITTPEPQEEPKPQPPAVLSPPQINPPANSSNATAQAPPPRRSGGGGGGGSSSRSPPAPSPAPPPAPPATSPPEVSAGDTVRVTVVATSVTDLGGAQFDLTFNSAVLQYQNAIEGPFLDAGNSSAAMLLGTTTVQNGALRNIIVLRVAQPGVTGTGDLVTLTFTATAAGSTNIALANVLLSNTQAQPIPQTLSIRKTIT